MNLTPMEVEDAIVELLRPLAETPGAKAVSAFQGQPGKDVWERLRRGLPAVLVLYAGSRASPLRGGGWKSAWRSRCM